jgi:hypothetical protein
MDFLVLYPSLLENWMPCKSYFWKSIGREGFRRKSFLVLDLSLQSRLTPCRIRFPHRLTGTVPTTLGMLSNLYDLRVPKNKLTGVMPSEIGLCVGLEHLYVEENRMSGDVPSELGQLTKLLDLKIYENEFGGTMPEQVCRLVTDDKLVLLHADCDKVKCDCCQRCS